MLDMLIAAVTKGTGTEQDQHRTQAFAPTMNDVVAKLVDQRNI